MPLEIACIACFALGIGFGLYLGVRMGIQQVLDCPKVWDLNPIFKDKKG